MPCGDGGVPYPSNYSELSRIAELTRQNCIYREALLDLLRTDEIKADVMFVLKDRHPNMIKLIEAEQVEHRKEDLKRLKTYFRKRKDAEKLGKVMLADPRKPLEPQLGFDPDEF